MNKKNDLDYLDKALTISKVKNGFMITPPQESYPTEEIIVFESFPSMTEFLRKWSDNEGKS